MNFQTSQGCLDYLQKINLIEVVNNALEFLKISSKNSIKLIKKKKHAIIYGDEDQLNRVFINH